jgi:hypothetical protein
MISENPFIVAAVTTWAAILLAFAITFRRMS